MNKTVLLGITGGIAAFKLLDLIPLLKKNRIRVIVMMSYGATRMVDPKKFAVLTGNPVYTNMYPENINYHQILTSRIVEHIQLAKKADLIVIAPATANSIGKIANGIADDYVTTTVLAARTPVLICPSMNTYMWKNPITQQNIACLQRYGYHILKPTAGLLACGDSGEGRLVSLEMIQDEITRLLERGQRLQGKKILITAGGTREYIDNVRFISNKSSGKMGTAIANVAYSQGAEVLLLRSITSQHSVFPIKEKTFETAEELNHLLQEVASGYEICFHTAAVSDFFVKQKVEGKITSKVPVSIALVPREKILSKIKIYNPSIHLIAFKAEWNVSNKELINRAVHKLQESGADYIIANDVGKRESGFEVDTNEVFIINKSERPKKIPLASKTFIAEKILEYTITIS